MFIWTVSDLIGAFMFGLLVLIGAIIFAMEIASRIKREYRQWRKK